MCLAGAVVASWSLTQEVAVTTNIFLTEFSKSSETFRGKLQWANRLHFMSKNFIISVMFLAINQCHCEYIV